MFNGTTINTDRLILRPLNIADVQAVYQYSSDQENTRYMCYYPKSSFDENESFLQRVTEEWEKAFPTFYEFAIVYQNIPIGAVSIYLNEEGSSGELGWIIDKKYWGNGFGTEAALAIKGFAINELGLKKLTAECDSRNKVSTKIMKKLGMELESDNGIRTYRKSGETAQNLVFSLTV